MGPVRTDTGDGRRGRVGNKWVTMVLFVLGEHPEPMRHFQVQRAIPGASKKMLTQTLRNLEGDGLVTRTGTSTTPRSRQRAPRGKGAPTPRRKFHPGAFTEP
ncbi:winged helix-turn-helix transcriptional regulator [Micromonospora sp. NBC_01638]|uniref:winged helix-turn-helix transcriptional regulator n=1 Tax=Micromonospora sp. NBC_01638 TaxID=2975982 RepID=UPI0038642080|nr:helix-turn-helix transcriptional regulator [Micromonospora sp. NBC_01638]